ncbi:hypothetical protein GHT06_008170 [Daphnia sinensis]|uniref:Uncharacterized protein n=1 Tax=Daphnia sinensis TaxID=1820382 RepID=A0AAD5LKI5_9CRUS|nr:hypothetical protein GHT06_008170 [Daphnia sinensis]
MPEHSGKLSEFVDIAPLVSVSINLLLNSGCCHMRSSSFPRRRDTTACTHIICLYSTSLYDRYRIPLVPSSSSHNFHHVSWMTR